MESVRSRCDHASDTREPAPGSRGTILIFRRYLKSLFIVKKSLFKS